MSFIFNLLGAAGEVSAINRQVNAIRGNYLARAHKIYTDTHPYFAGSIPLDPAAVRQLIGEYDAANDPQNTTVTSAVDKAQMNINPYKRDHALVLLAKIINQLINTQNNVISQVATNIPPLQSGENFKNNYNNSDVFLVYLLQQATLKYAGFYMSNALYSITDDIVAADPTQKYQLQLNATWKKLQQDFFADANAQAEFSKNYMIFRSQYFVQKVVAGGASRKGKHIRRRSSRQSSGHTRRTTKKR